ncbi:porin [Paraburkholderia acidipaludis]|uniref:porin n=1 Tax=Paraburkholderia acidipaludis TaxID=660537 RepID=UPI000480F796|nr:porin [Paraburkholderia acidipaludis]
MKKTTAALGAALLALSAQSAFAQSSVTLYGLVDTAIRYQTNANPQNDGLASMVQGVETPSRFGLKGSEDLGDGTQAIFKLENQFNLFNGALPPGAPLFSRNAYVGLSNNVYGTVTFGYQQTPFFEAMGNTFDPLTVADYWQDSWAYNPIGPYLFQSNSVKYKNTIGGLQIEAMYGFGGVAGSVGTNEMYAFTAEYDVGALQTLVGFQQNDVNGKKFNALNVGAVYAVLPSMKLLAGWLHYQDQTGGTDIYEQQSGLATSQVLSSTSSLLSPNRIDDNFYVGTQWQVTAPLALTAAGYYGHARNAVMPGDTTLGVGINYSATLLAEYSLSKRTEVYGTVDFTHGTGAYTIDYPGRNNQTAVAIGLRNIF